MTTQPIAGNQFFSSVVNKAAQLPSLNTADLSAALLAVTGTTTVNRINTGNLDVSGWTRLTGITTGSNVMLSLANQTVTPKGTAGTLSYVDGINVNDFTGAAAQVTTLPAAVAGVICVHAQSVDTTGGTDALTWQCEGLTDTFAAGQVVESRSGAKVTFDTSILTDKKLLFTPANATTNLMSIGSYVIFTCVTSGQWCVSQQLQHLGNGTTGEFAFAT